MSRIETKETGKQKIKKEIKEWVKIIAISLVVALAITMFVKPTLVKGHSMYPTIDEYDYLIINCIPYIRSGPKHGDIVVFETDLQTEEGKDKDLIKRVIGVPGDKIKITDGIVFRNGEPLSEPYINGVFTPGNTEETVIPEGYLFVMGDNRPNSLDSRDASVGEIPYDAIVGKVIVRLFPFDKIGAVE